MVSDEHILYEFISGHIISLLVSERQINSPVKAKKKNADNKVSSLQHKWPARDFSKDF